MKKTLNKTLKRTEFYLMIAIAVLAVIIQARSGQFFTGNNIVDLIRAFIIPAIFCLCEMIVLISGGTDVSFPAIASLSMFIVSTRMFNFGGSPLVLLLVGGLLGLAMGAINGILVGYFRFPTMVVTLGTSSLFYGIMYGPFSAQEYPAPRPLIDLGKSKLFTVTNTVSGLKSDMPVALIYFIILLIATYFILKYTMLGRGIYAIGGDEVSAKRAGFNIFAISMFIYLFSGFVAGFTGVLRTSMLLNCNPSTFNGIEMTVIAACVLGGVSVTGGKGTIFGAMLGIALMTIMNNSLILLGISTYWQKVFTGLVIIIGTGVTSYRQMASSNRVPSSFKEAGEALA